MCHWIGLHHMLVMFASQSHAWAQVCTATHLWECTSAQTMHWSLVVKMVFEAGFWTQVTSWRKSWRKYCLWSVKVQLMKNQKSDSEDYLTKSNYLNKTYSLQHFACCILEYKYIRSPNAFGVRLPVSQYMSGLFDRPAPIHL